MLAREVMELARVFHERHQIALSFLHQLVKQAHGMEVGHVHVGRPVQHQQRPLQPIHVRQRRRPGIDLRILLGCSDTAGRPAAVVWILVIHRVVGDAGHVHRRTKQLRLIGDGNQCEEAAVAQPPDAQPIAVDIRQRLEIIRRHPRILRILAPDVHIHAFAPDPAVADAAAIIRRDHDISLLQQILMKAVINGVVPLHVPPVIILVDAVAVDPHDCRVFARSIEVLRDEQPRRHLLPVGTGIVHHLGLDEPGSIYRGRHRIA